MQCSPHLPTQAPLLLSLSPSSPIPNASCHGLVCENTVPCVPLSWSLCFLYLLCLRFCFSFCLPHPKSNVTSFIKSLTSQIESLLGNDNRLFHYHHRICFMSLGNHLWPGTLFPQFQAQCSAYSSCLTNVCGAGLKRFLSGSWDASPRCILITPLESCSLYFRPIHISVTE